MLWPYTLIVAREAFLAVPVLPKPDMQTRLSPAPVVLFFLCTQTASLQISVKRHRQMAPSNGIGLPGICNSTVGIVFFGEVRLCWTDAGCCGMPCSIRHKGRSIMTVKSILITGCSSGIGYNAATTLQRRGWQVFATCRTRADCDRLEREGLTSLVLDYEDEATITTALETCLKTTGGTLDAVFNNGAYAIPGPVEDMSRNALRAIFEANFFGYFDLIRQVMPVMRAQGNGRIVNCSSVLGLAAMRYRGAYNATKFALEGMSDTLRLELRGTAIHVSLIEPGPIKTDFRKNAVKQFEKWVDWQNSHLKDEYETTLLDQLYKVKAKPDPGELGPEAVTAKLIHALESPNPKPRYFVTTPTYVVAFLMRVLTTRMQDRILGRMG